jgi:hypothetical protein
MGNPLPGCNGGLALYLTRYGSRERLFTTDGA